MISMGHYGGARGEYAVRLAGILESTLMSWLGYDEEALLLRSHSSEVLLRHVWGQVVLPLSSKRATRQPMRLGQGRNSSAGRTSLSVHLLPFVATGDEHGIMYHLGRRVAAASQARGGAVGGGDGGDGGDGDRRRSNRELAWSNPGVLADEHSIPPAGASVSVRYSSESPYARGRAADVLSRDRRYSSTHHIPVMVPQQRSTRASERRGDTEQEKWGGNGSGGNIETGTRKGHVLENFDIPLDNTTCTYGQWVHFDFGPNRKILPTRYTLRHSKATHDGFLRSWRVEASNDGEQWYTLRTHAMDQSFDAAHAMVTFTLPLPSIGVPSFTHRAPQPFGDTIGNATTTQRERSEVGVTPMSTAVEAVLQRRRRRGRGTSLSTSLAFGLDTPTTPLDGSAGATMDDSSGGSSNDSSNHGSKGNPTMYGNRGGIDTTNVTSHSSSNDDGGRSCGNGAGGGVGRRTPPSASPMLRRRRASMPVISHSTVRSMMAHEEDRDGGEGRGGGAGGGAGGNGGGPAFARHLRIVQTAPNSSGEWSMHVTGVEFYGLVAEGDDSGMRQLETSHLHVFPAPNPRRRGTQQTPPGVPEGLPGAGAQWRKATAATPTKGSGCAGSSGGGEGGGVLPVNNAFAFAPTPREGLQPSASRIASKVRRTGGAGGVGGVGGGVGGSGGVGGIGGIGGSGGGRMDGFGAAAENMAERREKRSPLMHSLASRDSFRREPPTTPPLLPKASRPPFCTSASHAHKHASATFGALMDIHLLHSFDEEDAGNTSTVHVENTVERQGGRQKRRPHERHVDHKRGTIYVRSAPRMTGNGRGSSGSSGYSDPNDGGGGGRMRGATLAAHMDRLAGTGGTRGSGVTVTRGLPTESTASPGKKTVSAKVHSAHGSPRDDNASPRHKGTTSSTKRVSFAPKGASRVRKTFSQTHAQQPVEVSAAGVDGKGRAVRGISELDDVLEEAAGGNCHTHRSRLIRFYREKAPHKVAGVDDTLVRFEGKEGALWVNLLKKYGPSKFERAVTATGDATEKWHSNIDFEM